MTDARHFRVFLSHSSTPKDREIVAAIRTFLRRRRFDVYLGEFDPQPGKKVYDKVEKKLKDSHAVVVIVTPNSSKSQWVLFELGMASLSKKPIIPIVQLGSDLPNPLAGIEHVAFGLDNPRPAFEAVARYLGALRDKWQSVQGLKELALAGGLLAGIELIEYLKGPKKTP